MRRELNLLSRIADAGAAGSDDRPYHAVDEALLIREIESNVRRLLSSRHRMCRAAPDYGLPALSDIGEYGEAFVAGLRDAVRLTILKYEPRIQNVAVTAAQEEGRRSVVHLGIEGRIPIDGKLSPFYFETSFDICTGNKRANH